MQNIHAKLLSEWMNRCFGRRLANDPVERFYRTLEELLELGQSLPTIGHASVHLHTITAIAQDVFSRPPGQPFKELGGFLVTAIALIDKLGLDENDALDTELLRIMRTDPAVFQRRNAQKQNRGLGVGYQWGEDPPNGISGATQIMPDADAKQACESHGIGVSVNRNVVDHMRDQLGHPAHEYDPERKREIEAKLRQAAHDAIHRPLTDRA